MHLGVIVYKTIFGLDLKENDSVVKSLRNVDVKYEVHMCGLALFVNDTKKSNHSKIYNVHNG